MEALVLLLVAVLIFSVLGVLGGLIMLIFSEDKKSALKVLIFSVIGIVIGFGGCAVLLSGIGQIGN